MAVVDIISALDAEAGAQRQEIIARAKKQAEQVLSEARGAADALEEEEERRLIGKAQSEEARILRRADRGRRSALAAARESLVSEVMTAAARNLSGLSQTPTYPPVFKQLLVEVWEAAASLDGSRTVLVDAGDKALAADLLSEMSLRAKLESAEIEGGGLVIASADGRHRLVNTLAGRLERARPFLLARVADILWPDD